MGLEDWESARTDLAAVVDENPGSVLALQSFRLSRSARCAGHREYRAGDGAVSGVFEFQSR